MATLRPHFDALRSSGQLTQGNDIVNIDFDFTMTCDYVGEVNSSGQAHGYGTATCDDGSLKGTFMYGQAHGKLVVKRPDTGFSVYEVRKGIRHGKETYRKGDDYVSNIWWRPGKNIGHHFDKSKEVTEDQAWYKKNGEIGTALDENWRDYI